MPKYTVIKTFQHGKINAVPGQTLNTDGEKPAIPDNEAKLLVAKGLLVEGVKTKEPEKKQDK